jgi:hypothetical protein
MTKGSNELNIGKSETDRKGEMFYRMEHFLTAFFFFFDGRPPVAPSLCALTIPDGVLIQLSKKKDEDMERGMKEITYFSSPA